MNPMSILRWGCSRRATTSPLAMCKAATSTISGRTTSTISACGGAPRQPPTSRQRRNGRRSSISTRWPQRKAPNWVYSNADCLAPDYRRCLISMSPDGGDALEIREFDLASKSFVKDGFFSPISKSRLTWLDADTLILMPAYEEAEQTIRAIRAASSCGSAARRSKRPRPFSKPRPASSSFRLCRDGRRIQRSRRHASARFLQFADVRAPCHGRACGKSRCRRRRDPAACISRASWSFRCAARGSGRTAGPCRRAALYSFDFQRLAEDRRDRFDRDADRAVAEGARC